MLYLYIPQIDDNGLPKNNDPSIHVDVRDYISLSLSLR